MTATGFLYRRLVRQPATEASSGGLRGQGVPEHRESAAVGGPAGRLAARATPAPDRSGETDAEAWRRREIFEHLPYGRHLAARSGMAGGPVEDIRRIAYLGLAEAVDRFDPDQGVTLLAYAASAIQAQARRHLLDVARAERAPRRIAEIAAGLPGAVEFVFRRLGRSPTVAEIAGHLSVPPEDVVDALDAADAHVPEFPDAPVDASDPGAAAIVAGDGDIESLVDPATLRALMARLSRWDKQILLMRFLRGMDRDRICQSSGVGPAYVDRLVAGFLAGLRAGVPDSPTPPVRHGPAHGWLRRPSAKFRRAL